MASNRLERIGTIYSRITGLLRAGAIKWENKPLWYNIYRAFPPLKEISFGSPTPDTPIKNIFYAEDKIRAKFHKGYRTLNAVRLDDRSSPSECQTFIQEYRKLIEKTDKSENDCFREAIGPFLKKSTAEFKRLRHSEAAEEDPDFESSTTSGTVSEEKLSEKTVDSKELFADIFKK